MNIYCRFCGLNEENLYLIENIDSSIILWLAKIVDINENTLPNSICYTCLCTVEDINYFISKCLKTFENFKKILQKNEQNKIDSDINLLNYDKNEEMNEEYLLDNISDIDEEIKDCFNNQEQFDIPKEMCRGSNNSLEINISNPKLINLDIHTNKKNIRKFNYKCRFCQFECNDREKVAYHMKREHLNNNKNALFKDLLTIVIDQRNIISNLNETFNSFADLNNFSIEKLNKIDNNNKSATYENGIDYVKLLNLADVYECKICKINFSKKSSFNKHWDAIHLSTEEKELRKLKIKSQEQYLCSECGKSLPTAFKLDYHIRMHKNDRRFKCEMCPKSYIAKSHLEVHINSHTGNESNKTYKCKLCNKRFRTPCELKIHIRFHGNDKPFKCDICNKTFYIISHLNDHKKTHTDEKTFLCSFLNCSLSYRSKRSLRKHFEKHLRDDNETI